MTGHRICCALPTNLSLSTLWSVELVQYTNSTDKMVQNSGTKSSHMSLGEGRQNEHLAGSCVPTQAQVHMFEPSADKKSMSVPLLLRSLTVSTLPNTHKSSTPSHWLFHDIIRCFCECLFSFVSFSDTHTLYSSIKCLSFWAFHSFLTPCIILLQHIFSLMSMSIQAETQHQSGCFLRVSSWWLRNVWIPHRIWGEEKGQKGKER